MCRFLMVKSKNKINPKTLLQEFALMCQESKTLDGDWQGDGWGIAIKIKNSKLKRQNWEWRVYKYLEPIWENQDRFSQLPETKMFVVHARSASFPNQKGIIEYNQPYVNEGYCFVFNGMIKGVKLKSKVQGEIGAQKIFHLLTSYLKANNPENSLKRAKQLLLGNSKIVEGLNIGLVTKNNFFILCQYELEYSDYFSIRYNRNKEPVLVVSEEIGNYSFDKMKKGEIKVF